MHLNICRYLTEIVTLPHHCFDDVDLVMVKASACRPGWPGLTLEKWLINLKLKVEVVIVM